MGEKGVLSKETKCAIIDSILVFICATRTHKGIHKRIFEGIRDTATYL